MTIVQDIVASGIDKEEGFPHAFPNWSLARLEQLLPKSMAHTAETGCGKSTILFSRLSQRHTVFCLDDRNIGKSSVNLFQSSQVTNQDALELVFGPSQVTLPTWVAGPGAKAELDCVLIDGPHGFPFAELEYYYFYPRLKKGGFLIVDDLHIPTVSQLADFIAEDAMFELVEVVGATAVFRRTQAKTFNPTGDGWYNQDYNRRRLTDAEIYPSLKALALQDGKQRRPFAETVKKKHYKAARDAVRLALLNLFRRR